MAWKGFLIVDPECGRICDDSIEAMKEYIDAGETEVVEVAEALRRGIDIGTPEAVPFVCIASEATGKCLTKMYFHDEEGKVVLQPYPTVYEGGEAAAEASEAEREAVPG